MKGGLMKEEVFQAALTGLLHDIGKFLGRVSPTQLDEGSAQEPGASHAKAAQQFIEAYVPAAFKVSPETILFHHKPELLQPQSESLYTLTYLVRLADRLAAGETAQPETRPGQGNDLLTPILSQVELKQPLSQTSSYYQPAPLQLERNGAGNSLLEGNNFFILSQPPIPAQVAEAYWSLWESGLQPDLERWKNSPSWEQQSQEAYLTTLQALLRRYLSFVPSTSPWPGDEDDLAGPDVSLFNHLKLTATIATCLAGSFSMAEIKDLSLQSEGPVAVLVRGDLSGIQGFIYRVTRPETDATFEHVAKRLRGRSFYLALLEEVIAQWLIRQMELPVTNILFVGGGQFDVLIPWQQEDKLQSCLRQLEQWLLDNFYGELGLQLSSVPLKPADFGDMRSAYHTLNTQLESEKLRKWHNYLANPEFFIPGQPLYHLCRTCRITPLADPGICRLCEKHADMGRILPHTTHLAYVYEPGTVQWPAGSVSLSFSSLGLEVGLLERPQVEPFIRGCRGPARLVALNPRDSFLRSGPAEMGQEFGFLANTAPVAKIDLPVQNETVERGEVLPFEAMAALSSGAERIGILKADVDYLGLLFGTGLATSSPAAYPTLARVMTMSSTLDLFFAGWLNNLCDRVFQGWYNRQQAQAAEDRHPWWDKVTGLFYVIYSGGDDLFIVGPWDETLELAQQLQADFATYACHNPNLSLSAGIVQVKPRYPVQHFATLVDGAEKQAKDEGRARVTVFGQTVEWANVPASFASALRLGKKFQALLEGNEMPRTLPARSGAALSNPRTERRDKTEAYVDASPLL
jgi:CRISPR-associated protein Csm1